MTELVATSRDALAETLHPFIYSKHSATRIVDNLIDTGAVRVVDPDDPELIERVAEAIADSDPHVYSTTWNERARWALGAVFPG